MLEQLIIRAWKDREYRERLGTSVSGLVPEHPAGCIDLSDADLELAAGGQVCGGPLSTYGTNNSLGWRCISVSRDCG